MAKQRLGSAFKFFKLILSILTKNTIKVVNIGDNFCSLTTNIRVLSIY